LPTHAATIEPAIPPAPNPRQNDRFDPERSETALVVPDKNWEYVAEYPIQELHSHPLQKELFVGLNEAGIAELAEDIQKRGLQNPLEILPNGTIINGHQRYFAYQWLGLEHIPVYIRHDFTEQPPDAVNEHIIQDNLQRKHLHPLEIARGYMLLREYYEERRAAGVELSFTLRDLRTALARRFAISSRTLDRYMAALKAPPIFQDCCIHGRFPFHLLCKVGGLSSKKKAALMERVDKGEYFMTVIEEYTRPHQREQDRASKALLALARQLKRSIDDIEENIDKIPYRRDDLQQCQPIIEKGFALLANLLEYYKNPPVIQLSETYLRRTSHEDAPLD
jgi:ParB/RepB/Spo0J family partition protein